jgi:hypothetical protein
MPCTCDRLAGPRSPPEAARVRLKPVTAALMARSRAMGPREPCQGREAAALSGLPHVLRGSRAGASGREFAGFESVDGGVRGIFLVGIRTLSTETTARATRSGSKGRAQDLARDDQLNIRGSRNSATASGAGERPALRESSSNVSMLGASYLKWNFLPLSSEI